MIVHVISAGRAGVLEALRGLAPQVELRHSPSYPSAAELQWSALLVVDLTNPPPQWFPDQALPDRADMHFSRGGAELQARHN